MRYLVENMGEYENRVKVVNADELVRGVYRYNKEYIEVGEVQKEIDCGNNLVVLFLSTGEQLVGYRKVENEDKYIQLI